MGKRGPKPLPDAVLRARGSRRAGKPEEEAPLPPGRPQPPEWLIGEARKIWDRMVPVLEEMRVLTTADVMALARYSRLFVRWLRAEAFLDKHGSAHPCKDGNGKVKCLMPFPQVGEAAKLASVLARLEAEFGLTPSARTGVKVDRNFGASPEMRSFRAQFLTPRPIVPRSTS